MSDITPNPETRIALFQRKEVRRAIHNNEWWFVIADVVAVLTDSVNPSGYLKDMRRRDPALADLFKGGGKLPPPLASSSTRRADASCCNVGTPKASFD
jgi:DNA-damage-inducible protein D